MSHMNMSYRVWVSHVTHATRDVAAVPVTSHVNASRDVWACLDTREWVTSHVNESSSDLESKRKTQTKQFSKSPLWSDQIPNRNGKTHKKKPILFFAHTSFVSLEKRTKIRCQTFVTSVIYIYIHIYIHIYTNLKVWLFVTVGWLRLVGSLKL